MPFKYYFFVPFILSFSPFFPLSFLKKKNNLSKDRVIIIIWHPESPLILKPSWSVWDEMK